MAVYPPISPRSLGAQEFELSSAPYDAGRPGPSRVQSSSKARNPIHHASNSASHVLFSAPSTSLPAFDKEQIPASSPEIFTPRRLSRAQFLNEDLDHLFIGTHNEEAHVPNFGQMLGSNPDAGEDHFAVAQGMKTRWKRKLYLLMEEPSSGREAFFVHILVTGAILFRLVKVGGGSVLTTVPVQF